MAFVRFEGPVVLDVPADPAAMFIVRALVGKISEKIGFAADESDKLVLAVDEACTNVIRHAYGQSIHERIIVTLTLGPDYFEVMIGISAAVRTRRNSRGVIWTRSVPEDSESTLSSPRWTR